MIVCYTSVYYSLLYYNMLCYAVLYYIMLDCITLCYNIIYFTILCCTASHCTILYYAMVYYTILYYIMLCYNTPLFKNFSSGHLWAPLAHLGGSGTSELLWVLPGLLQTCLPCLSKTIEKTKKNKKTKLFKEMTTIRM